MSLNLKGFGESFSEAFNKTFGLTLEDLLKKETEKRKEKKTRKVQDTASEERFNLMRELASDEVKKEVAGKFRPKQVLKKKDGRDVVAQPDAWEVEMMSPDERMKAALKAEEWKKGKDKAGIMRSVMSDLLRIEGDADRAYKLRQKMREERKQDAIEAEDRAWGAWKKRDDHTRDRNDVERLAREAEEEERYRRRLEESEARKLDWYNIQKNDSFEEAEQGLLKNQTIHAAQAYYARNPDATASSFSVSTGLQLDPQLLTAIHTSVRNSPNPEKIALDAAMNKSEAFKAVQRTAPDYAASQQKFDEWMGRNLGAAGRSGRRGNQGFLQRQGLTQQQIAEALKPSADRSDEFRDFIFNKGVRWFELEEELSQGNQGQTTVRLTDSINKLGEMADDLREPTATETGRERGRAEVTKSRVMSQARWNQVYGQNEPFAIVADEEGLNPNIMWNPNMPAGKRSDADKRAAWNALQAKIATKVDEITGETMVFDQQKGVWVTLDKKK